jgi:hypothetical protein
MYLSSPPRISLLGRHTGPSFRWPTRVSPTRCSSAPRFSSTSAPTCTFFGSTGSPGWISRTLSMASLPPRLRSAPSRWSRRRSPPWPTRTRATLTSCRYQPVPMPKIYDGCIFSFRESHGEHVFISKDFILYVHFHLEREGGRCRAAIYYDRTIFYVFLKSASLFQKTFKLHKGLQEWGCD